MMKFETPLTRLRQAQPDNLHYKQQRDCQPDASPALGGISMTAAVVTLIVRQAHYDVDEEWRRVIGQHHTIETTTITQ